MIALMRKDFRLILPVAIGGVALTMIPYVLAVASWMAASDREKSRGYLGDALHLAAYSGLWLVALLSSAVGGAAFAQERQQRSADFLAMLPVRRSRIVTSKILVFAAVLGLLWLVHACVWIKLPSYFHSALNDLSNGFEVALLSGSSLLMIFGVAWLFSSFLTSPTWAACVALASIFTVFTAIWLADSIRHKVGNSNALFLITLSIGIASFVGGTVYYLRRIEP